MNDDDLRSRWKSLSGTSRQETDDVVSLWDDQKRMQAEDKRLETELKQAKRKAKELKKTLRRHKIGESQEFAFDYLDKSREFGFKTYKKARKVVGSNPRKYALITGVAVIAVIGIGLISRRDSSPATLGDSTGIKIQEDLPREKPSFSLLYPSGTSSSDYDVVRISPDGTAPSYTFLDRFTEDGQIFRVTQQEIPDNFELSSAATDFQATSVIQVDNNKIYHGYSVQGGIQSLLFIKDKKLVLIRSPQKFSDDSWAAYYLSLK